MYLFLSSYFQGGGKKEWKIQRRRYSIPSMWGLWRCIGSTVNTGRRGRGRGQGTHSSWTERACWTQGRNKDTTGVTGSERSEATGSVQKDQNERTVRRGGGHDDGKHCTGTRYMATTTTSKLQVTRRGHLCKRQEWAPLVRV